MNFLPHLVYLQLEFLGQINAVTGATVVWPHEDAPWPTELTALLEGPAASGFMVTSMRVQSPTPNSWRYMAPRGSSTLIWSEKYAAFIAHAAHALESDL